MAAVLTATEIFDMVIENFTYGLVPDVNTALTGCIYLAFLYAAGQIIFDILSHNYSVRRAEHEQGLIFAQNVFDSSKAFNEARSYRSLRDTSEEGSFDYDYYNSLYRAKLNESVSLSVKTGEPMSSSGGLFVSGGSDTHFDSLLLDNAPASSSGMSSGRGFYSGDPGPTDADRPYWEEEYHA